MTSEHEKRLLAAAIKADRKGLLGALQGVTMAQAHADLEALRARKDVPGWARQLLADVHALAGPQMYAPAEGVEAGGPDEPPDTDDTPRVYRADGSERDPWESE